MSLACGRRQFLAHGSRGLMVMSVADMANGQARDVDSRSEHLWRLIDDDTYYGGTFGSFNSKIAVVGDQWFLPYRVGHEESGTFRLVVSKDRGQTWGPVPLESMPCYQVPSMVADRHGQLHLAFHHEGAARHARFSSDGKGQFRLDFVRVIGPAGPKFALTYDDVRQRLYFSHRFGGQLTIATLDLDGQLLNKKVIIKRVGAFPPSGSATYEDAQYQSITVDPSGDIHLIYTRTVCRNAVVNHRAQVVHRYAGVYYLRSNDGAATWEDGRGTALNLPADMTAGTPIHHPAQDHDELTIWGQSLAADGKNVHILYWAEDSLSKRLCPHYVRLDATGQEIARSLPPLVTLHTALALDPKSNEVFAFGTDAQRRAVVARAEAGGKAWQIIALAKDLSLRVPYAHTTAPHLTPAGDLLAALTDRPSAAQSATDPHNKVYFLRFAVHGL